MSFESFSESLAVQDEFNKQELYSSVEQNKSLSHISDIRLSEMKSLNLELGRIASDVTHAAKEGRTKRARREKKGIETNEEVRGERQHAIKSRKQQHH